MRARHTQWRNRGRGEDRVCVSGNPRRTLTDKPRGTGYPSRTRVMQSSGHQNRKLTVAPLPKRLRDIHSRAVTRGNLAHQRQAATPLPWRLAVKKGTKIRSR